MGVERWSEWEYIELLMDFVWDLSRGKEKLRPSWRCCPCGDVLAVLQRTRVLPRRWLTPERAARWLRSRMADASPKELSEESGLTREHLSRLKSGRRRQPTFETFVLVALALDIGIPFLASITLVSREQVEASTQPKKRRSRKRKCRGRPRQRNADEFWRLRVSFWRTQPRDLKAFWEDEVTENAAEVTRRLPPEVTPRDHEVTPRDREVTPEIPEVVKPPGSAGTRRTTERPPHDREGRAGTLGPFMTVESRVDDPPPKLRALLSRLEEEIPYPVSLSHVTEMREAQASRLRGRRENERLAEERKAQMLSAPMPSAEEHRAARPQAQRPRAKRPRTKESRAKGPRAKGPGSTRDDSGPTANTQDTRPDRSAMRGGRMAGSLRDTTHGHQNSQAIPMVFRGVYGLFEPLDPQPTREPLGTVHVVPEAGSARRQSPTPPTPASDRDGGDASADDPSKRRRAPPRDRARDLVRDASGERDVREGDEEATFSGRTSINPRHEGSKTSASPDRRRRPMPRPVSVVDPSWWAQVPELPTAIDVPGFDLANNWGATPDELRPLFALMENVSKIQGSARIFALISKRQADFQPDAHDESRLKVSLMRYVYQVSSIFNPPLAHGDAAAELGRGGLFQEYSPTFLWTGIQELRDKAPLLNAPPEVIYIPRLAAFGAAVHLHELLTSHRVENIAEVMIGWERHTLLANTWRGGSAYRQERDTVFASAEAIGIDLDDAASLPGSLSVESWPGVAAVFTGLTGVRVEEGSKG